MDVIALCIFAIDGYAASRDKDSRQGCRNSYKTTNVVLYLVPCMSFFLLVDFELGLEDYKRYLDAFRTPLSRDTYTERLMMCSKAWL